MIIYYLSPDQYVVKWKDTSSLLFSNFDRNGKIWRSIIVVIQIKRETNFNIMKIVKHAHLKV